MPWNVLGTPQKFNFRTREKWKFRPHNWVNKQSRVIEKLKIVFETLILDGIFKRRKNLLADFFKNSTFYNMIFFHYAVNFPWHDMARVWLDDRNVLGFCGVLYSETFKALWPPQFCTLCVQLKLHLMNQSNKFHSMKISLKLMKIPTNSFARLLWDY